MLEGEDPGARKRLALPGPRSRDLGQGGLLKMLILAVPFDGYDGLGCHGGDEGHAGFIQISIGAIDGDHP